MPIRPKRGVLPTRVESLIRRYTYLDPAVVVEPDVTPDDFRRAMFGIYVGGTIKITWADRHGEADSLLLDHVDLSGAALADMGASDGSTSVDLIRRLPDDYASYTVSDRYVFLSWADDGSHRYLFDEDDTCVLVSGPRVVAWPHLSQAVAWMYARRVRRARQLPRRRVALVNPDLRHLMAEEPKVSVVEHDIFTSWALGRLQVVKTANVLRRLYFSDAQISTALAAIRDSLDDGGHLLLADHSRVPGEPPAGGLYRRHGPGFVVVATSNRSPEIHDLVLTLGS